VRRALCGTAALLWWVTVFGTVSGEIIRVPEDQPSVLAAVDLAASGDSVLVGPGTWTDRETRLVVISGTPLYIPSAAFLKAGITVIGVAGPENTILDAGSDPTWTVETLLYTGPGEEPVVIEGLTITGGGVGLHASSVGRIELVNCWLVGNGHYASLSKNAEVAFCDCRIEGNDQSGEDRYAIDAWMTRLELRNCRVANNPRGGIEVYESASVIIDGCEIVDHPECRGVSLMLVSNVQVRNSLFLRNSVDSQGGALAITECDNGEVAFCVFAHDSAAGGQAGALYMYNSTIRATNNTFYGIHGGHVAGSASAVLIDGPDGGFQGNVVVSCSPGPALRKVMGASHPETGCNLLWDNPGGNYFGDWVPASTDIFADPQFCDAAAGDYSLHSTSPAAPENSPTCGLIGALGVDCGPISIESTSWGRIKNLYR
jgi:hypothetical protein